jgi:hypothetical protein
MMVAFELLLLVLVLLVVRRRNAVRVVMMMMSMAMVVMMRMGMMMNMLRQRVCHPRWRPPYNVLFDWEVGGWEVRGWDRAERISNGSVFQVKIKVEIKIFWRSAWNGSGWLG